MDTKLESKKTPPNPKGRLPESLQKIRWDFIDQILNTSIQWAAGVIEGTDDDWLALEKPKERIDARFAALREIIKLAPQRMANSDGSNLDNGFIILPVQKSVNDLIVEGKEIDSVTASTLGVTGVEANNHASGVQESSEDNLAT